MNRKPRTALEPAAVMGCRWIPLTRGAFALVDQSDFETLATVDWHLHSDGYAVRNVFVDGKWTQLKMHRAILTAGDELEVDHRNRNKLDNRRDNLRLATKPQNRRNQVARKNNTSGFKGVIRYTWNRRKSRTWLAQIRVDGKRVHIGYFETAEEAARAYDAAAKKHHGEFASLNFA